MTVPSAPIDPRTPVIVGVGQSIRRPEDEQPPVEPADLMAEALRAAGADAGAAGPRLLAAADSVRVPRMISWRYRDPGRLAAARAGAHPGESWLTPISGSFVQTLVNRTGLDIVAGRNDVVLITGAESWRTRSAARAAGVDLGWTTQGDDVAPATPYGDDHPLFNNAETDAGIVAPTAFYPLVESALRAAAGRTIAEHQAHLGRLWSRFSEVAAANPWAWSRRAYTPDETITPAPDNRMVGFPYPKRLNSNLFVDQGAAVIVCSVERARDLGIPRDRWVFVHAGTDAHDHWLASHRADLRSSPAIRIAGRKAFDLAGTTSADLAHVDLYSCFPSAVQVAAAELGLRGPNAEAGLRGPNAEAGLGGGRDLTVTGGMSFAGGPFNDYSLHAVATMAERLRADPGSLGLVTANGGYLTKHALGVYGTEPPVAGVFRHADVQAEVDALPAVALDEHPAGPATVEAYTVVHGRDGEPERASLALTMPDGRRAWASTTEPATMADLCREEGVGRSARVGPGGTVEVR
jgi:acetyl-CoA C-acetyltransferase